MHGRWESRPVQNHNPSIDQNGAFKKALEIVDWVAKWFIRTTLAAALIFVALIGFAYYEHTTAPARRRIERAEIPAAFPEQLLTTLKQCSAGLHIANPEQAYRYSWLDGFGRNVSAKTSEWSGHYHPDYNLGKGGGRQTAAYNATWGLFVVRRLDRAARREPLRVVEAQVISPGGCSARSRNALTDTDPTPQVLTTGLSRRLAFELAVYPYTGWSYLSEFDDQSAGKLAPKWVSPPAAFLPDAGLKSYRPYDYISPPEESFETWGVPGFDRDGPRGAFADRAPRGPNGR